MYMAKFQKSEVVKTKLKNLINEYLKRRKTNKKTKRNKYKEKNSNFQYIISFVSV